MPSIYDIKPGFQALLRPLVRRFASARITANGVTLAAGVNRWLTPLLSFPRRAMLLAGVWIAVYAVFFALAPNG